MHSELFKEYLIAGNCDGIKKIPKSDLHNHASNGGNRKFIEKMTGLKFEEPPESFDSLFKMEEWASAVIKRHCHKSQRWEAAFAQAADDNITVLTMSFARDELDCKGKFPAIGGYVEYMNFLKAKYIPETAFWPELAYYMGMDIEHEKQLIDEILDSGFFKSVDLWALSEPAEEYSKFKPFFRKAKEKGLRLKAHVGEFNDADDIIRVAEELELDEIQHGIAAVNSAPVMKWLANNNVQLNVCPTSNVMLQRVKNYNEHPVRILYDYGIKVTINTDDMLIFNSSVSQEYLNLHKCGLMTADELDKIRIYGLSQTNRISQINRL